MHQLILTRNRTTLDPGKDGPRSLLWVPCFREPCMSQAQKFIEYTTGHLSFGVWHWWPVTLHICSCVLYHLGHKEINACPTSLALWPWKERWLGAIPWRSVADTAADSRYKWCLSISSRTYAFQYSAKYSVIYSEFFWFLSLCSSLLYSTLVWQTLASSVLELPTLFPQLMELAIQCQAYSCAIYYLYIFLRK